MERVNVMKIFLSYRFTGEDQQELSKMLGMILEILESAGHSVFCSFSLEDYFREQEWSVEEIYAYCLAEQEKCDIVLAIVKSEDRSRGMEVELEHARTLNQKCVLAIRKELGLPRFREQASYIFEYTNLNDLCQQLDNVVRVRFARV